jgi:hypothetical protein
LSPSELVEKFGSHYLKEVDMGAREEKTFVSSESSWLDDQKAQISKDFLSLDGEETSKDNFGMIKYPIKCGSLVGEYNVILPVKYDLLPISELLPIEEKSNFESGVDRQLTSIMEEKKVEDLGFTLPY